MKFLSKIKVSFCFKISNIRLITFYILYESFNFLAPIWFYASKSCTLTKNWKYWLWQNLNYLLHSSPNSILHTVKTTAVSNNPDYRISDARTTGNIYNDFVCQCYFLNTIHRFRIFRFRSEMKTPDIYFNSVFRLLHRSNYNTSHENLTVLFPRETNGQKCFVCKLDGTKKNLMRRKMIFDWSFVFPLITVLI